MPLLETFANASVRGFGAFAPAAAAGAYELISTVTLGSSYANFSFTSLPTTFKHFQIRLSVRDSGGANYNTMMIRVNNNSSSGNYYYNTQAGGGAGGQESGFYVGSNFNTIVADGALANTFGFGVVDFFDVVQTNTRKSVLGRFAGTTSLFNGGNPVILTGFTIQTAAISSIQVTGPGGYMAGSRVSLYGIKG